MRKIYVVTEYTNEEEVKETRVSLFVDDGRNTTRTKVLSVTGTTAQQNEEIRRIIDMLKQVAIDIIPY